MKLNWSSNEGETLTNHIETLHRVTSEKQQTEESGEGVERESKGGSRRSISQV